MKRTILLVALLSLSCLEARAQGSATDFCKSSKCVVELSPWLEQLKACEGSHAKVVTLEKRIKGLEGERDEAKSAVGSKEQELSSCTAAAEEAEKRAKEASDKVEALTKEVEALKKEVEEQKAIASGTGYGEKLKEVADLANAWKKEADRIKEEAEAAKKEVTELKADVDLAKKEADTRKVEADAAKAEVTQLKGKLDSLETKLASAESKRGLSTSEKEESSATETKATKADDGSKADAVAKGDGADSSDLRKLQEALEETRRSLSEEKKEKEASEGAIRQVLTDLVDHLGKSFECSSFSVEMRGGARILKGSVAETRHRDEALKMVLDSPVSKLVHSSEIDVTASGGQVCFVKTRAPGWLMARERSKGGSGIATFLRRFLDQGVIALLPRASSDSDCGPLGDVVKSLELGEHRVIGADALFVRSGDDRVAQCYDSGLGWKLRPVGVSDGKSPALLLVPEGRP